MAFVAALVVAVPVIRYQNREQWFFLDEWDYLAGRDLNNFHDLVRSHNGHWATVPIVIFRVLFRAVGLNHYWPYQAVLIAAHLTLAGLIRMVMRRAGVDPWIATLAAILFVFFGSGRANIGWAFQIGFVASVAFGFGHLLLADHDGPVDRRDGLGLLCGLAALMSHGPGVTMVAGVGVAVLIRRGWKPALLHVGPLAAVFVAWFVTWRAYDDPGNGATVRAVAAFSWREVQGTFVLLGQSPLAGIALAALAVAGGVLLSRRASLGELRRSHAAVIGLLVAAAGFVVTSAAGRAGSDFGADPRASRYVHLVAAMVLPAVAVGASELIRVRRWLGIVAGALLLLGLPGNISALRPSGLDRFTLGDPVRYRELAALAATGRYPRDHHPDPFEAPDVTVGWLADQRRAGRIPAPRNTPAAVRANALLSMSLEKTDGEPVGRCRPYAASRVVPLQLHQELRAGAARATITRVVNGKPDGSVSYWSLDEPLVTITPLLGPVDLLVTFPTGIFGPVSVCG